MDKKQGRLTMQYYIYHAFIVRLLGVVIIMFSFPQSFLQRLSIRY